MLTVTGRKQKGETLVQRGERILIKKNIIQQQNEIRMNAIINKPKGDKMSSNFEGKPIDEFKPGDIITMVGPGQTEKWNPDYSLVGKRLKLISVKNGVIRLENMDRELAFGEDCRRYYWLCCQHWEYYED